MPSSERRCAEIRPGPISADANTGLRRISSLASVHTRAPGPRERPDGELVGQDGRTYAVATPRIGRHEIEALIETGSPVVTYLPGGRLIWHDEDDAWSAWADARNAAESVTAGRWEAVDGSTAVVLVWSSDGGRG